MSASADRILFVTSNGTGLGHLTRSMAIARRLDPSFEPLILTLSAAAPVVRELGFPVEYVASYATPGAGSDWRWSRRLRRRLRAAIAEASPRVLVFDGAHPYQALIDALGTGRAGGEMRAVWCRRPMWRPGSNPGALERTGFFDAVLEPGEFAEPADRGPTVARRAEARLVHPIVYCDPDELLPRADAERELGLEPGKLHVLIQLGQGPEVRDAVDRCVRYLAGRDGVQVAALSSAIAALLSVPEGVLHLRSTYPMSRYYAAFDLAVSACGYNAYHELIRFGVPALYVPMPRETDDQATRARFAESAGVGFAAGEASPGAEPSAGEGPPRIEAPATSWDPRRIETPGPEDPPTIEERLEELLDPERRAAMRGRLAELRFPNGAGEAARWLQELATAGRGARRGRAGRWRRWLRQPLRSARKAAPFAARLPIHAAAFVVQTITRRPPRTVVLALGVRPGELEAGLDGVLARTGDPETGPAPLAPTRDAKRGTTDLPSDGPGLADPPASLGDPPRPPVDPPASLDDPPRPLVDPPERVLVITDSLEFAPLLRAGVGFEHIPGPEEPQAKLAGEPYDAFLRRRLALILAERRRPRRALSLGREDPALLEAITAPKRRRRELLGG